METHTHEVTSHEMILEDGGYHSLFMVFLLGSPSTSSQVRTRTPDQTAGNWSEPWFWFHTRWSWIRTSHLLQRFMFPLIPGGLHSHGSTTVGMLDLGGGSTQITFSPRDEKTIQDSPVDSIRSFQMFSNTHTVYTHSYLGLGLMSARLAILGGPSSPAVPELLSTCLPAEFSGTWEHADIIYTVKGQEAGGPAYEACRSIVEKVLFRKVMKASEAADVDFYAFSYYYDRAVDLGVIDEKRGGTIRVSDYVQAAQTVCSRVIRGPLQSPFLCLDLVYISVLLQELGLPPHKQLKLARTINQVETSWALGATFHYMETLKRP
uniref:Ectonucleoside triphosphate diphosphohydrolase 6 n=1 Tax=Nothobranchius furzeri TaxID=105023 RepID=A0A8C6P1B8_NOTFU